MEAGGGLVTDPTQLVDQGVQLLNLGEVRVESDLKQYLIVWMEVGIQ